MATRIKPEYTKLLRGRIDLFRKIADEFGFKSDWGIIAVRRWVHANKPNGKLTTKSALKILAKGLAVRENELLEEVNYNVNANRETNPVDAG